MVERLKEAVEKARRMRMDEPPPAETAPARPTPTVEAGWGDIEPIDIDPERLHQGRIVTYDRWHFTHSVFDVLRTRIVKACADHGWKRIGICSPTKNCGKSMMTLNLAFSAARQKDLRTVALDLDLRSPRMAAVLGAAGDFAIGDLLRGQKSWPSALRRVGDNLALGLNRKVEPNPAELLQSRAAGAALDALTAALKPDLVLVDLPPLLIVDDVIGFAPRLDAVMLVVAAGSTHPRQIEESERLLSSATNFLGVVLNKYQGTAADAKAYEYTGG